MLWAVMRVALPSQRKLHLTFVKGDPIMQRPISEIAFTATIKTAQEKRGSRASYAKMEQRGE